MRLEHRDFERFNAAVAQMYTAAFSYGALTAISQTLPRLLGGELGVAGLNGRSGTSMQTNEAEVRASLLSFPISLFLTHPRVLRRDLEGSVVKISDLLSRREWHQQPLYQVSREIHSLEEDLGIDFKLGDGSMVRTCVMRKRRTFKERERYMFQLLVPHLTALLQKGCAKCKPSLAGMGLTQREQEVLLWISEGKTNSEVGQILEISAGTVKIHLEHIYKKLGVEGRHGAARYAFEKLYHNNLGHRQGKLSLS